MKKSFLLLTLVTLLSTFSFAQMKCAPGKCGSGMSSAKPETVKHSHKGNTAYKAINIKSAEYSCATCNMDIKALDYAAQLVIKEGETYFFDDIGCMILWLKAHPEQSVKRYVKTLDTHRWIAVEKAHYSRIAPSPMGYGFAAVEASKKGLISYKEMGILMLKGETLRDPVVKKKLLP